MRGKSAKRKHYHKGWHRIRLCKKTVTVNLHKDPICPVTWDFQYNMSECFYDKTIKAVLIIIFSQYCIFSPSVGVTSAVSTTLQICYALIDWLLTVSNCSNSPNRHAFFSPFTWAIGRADAPSVILLLIVASK